MKVVHLDEGHNFHVDWHFKFWREKLENLVARQILLFAKPCWHSRLASLQFKFCAEKPHIAFVENVKGN
jgi:hypothetical protein